VRTRANKGFTLIEMLIVISLIAIITAIAVPQFTRYTQNNALQSAARELAGDIQIIRQRAAADSAAYTLQFLDNTRYTYTLPPNPAVIKNVTTLTDYSDIRFDENTFPGNRIMFQPRGTMAQWGRVRLTNNRGSTVLLTASPPIGRINVVYTPD
jgi:prepilin-type N-terminal cleavage/methylation domain-containing protein